MRVAFVAVVTAVMLAVAVYTAMSAGNSITAVANANNAALVAALK
jgi:hypothetical protein